MVGGGGGEGQYRDVLGDRWLYTHGHTSDNIH